MTNKYDENGFNRNECNSNGFWDRDTIALALIALVSIVLLGL